MNSELSNGYCHLPTESPIMAYINRIKNKRKKAYAVAYLNSILTDGQEPYFKDFGLSYMGAQSVRLVVTAERLKIEADL